MKLAISNIAWTVSHDYEMLRYISQLGYNGLEIAPTRLYPNSPYDNIETAKTIVQGWQSKYNLTIPSMQSIWYGRNERLFGSRAERSNLLRYTMKAMDYAAAIGCQNLVLGSPKNRIIQDSGQYSLAVKFFEELASYAQSKKVVLLIEANPKTYGTNYINTTTEAFKLAGDVNLSGFKVNLDIGTMIQNHESLTILSGYMTTINHVHISEPNLEPIIKRTLHHRLYELLAEAQYDGYISLEMKRPESIETVKSCAKYVKEVFDEC